MTTAGYAPQLVDVVAASLLRLGMDTSVCRMAKTFGPPAAGWLERLAVAAWSSGRERSVRLDAARKWSRSALEAAGRMSIRAVPAPGAPYPTLLREIIDPPIVLWVKGRIDTLERAPAVAIVGSRQATPAGLVVARRLGRDLAEAGVVVVSGLARGIDGAAHEGALEGGGETIAVLGCGLDIVYPREHEALADRIAASGVLVSEFPPGMQPLAHHFPMRNRIISGLVKAVVVVEASEKSGSLITAKAALEQGRDVLAVPGSVAAGRYRGAHALIKDGARLVETVDDILDEIGLSGYRARAETQAKSSAVSGLEAVMVVGEVHTAEELAVQTGRPASDVLAELGRLELAGKIARAPGGGFVRLDGPATVRGFG